jgi:hypothetical protein
MVTTRSYLALDRSKSWHCLVDSYKSTAGFASELANNLFPVFYRPRPTPFSSTLSSAISVGFIHIREFIMGINIGLKG